MPDPLHLNVRLDRAGQLASRARIFFQIWHCFEIDEIGSATVERLTPYEEFFRFDPYAHFIALIVTTAALFETGNDNTINLWTLAHEVESAEALKLLDEAKGVASKVTQLRSNLFAHRSASLDYNGYFEKVALTFEELGDLTVRALDIADILLRSQGLDVQFRNPDPLKQAADMLSALAGARYRSGTSI